LQPAVPQGLFIEKKTSKIYIVQSAKIPTWILKEDEKDFI
jgi:hypothetical protein